MPLCPFPAFPLIHSPEHAPTVVHLAIGPIVAQLGLGGSAIGADPIVEGAVPAIIIEIGAGGDHLHPEIAVRFPVHLAEVRWAPSPHQRLECHVALVAADAELKVPAAGGSSDIVGGAAWRRKTGVLSGVDREAGRRWRCGERERGEGQAIHHLELVGTGPPAGGHPDRLEGRGPSVTKRGAGRLLPVLPQMTTGHMQRGFGKEALLLPPHPPEGDVLGVAQEPGGLVVEAGHAILESSDAKGHAESSALGAEGGAGRDRGQKDLPLACGKAGDYDCKTLVKPFTSGIPGPGGGLGRSTDHDNLSGIGGG